MMQPRLTFLQLNKYHKTCLRQGVSWSDPFTSIGLKLNEEQIKQTRKNKFKSIVKFLVEKAAFSYLQNLKSNHTKVKCIEYKDFEIQPYLDSNLFNTEEATALLNLRGECINGVKMCFKSQFQNDKRCKLGCEAEDTIEHIFECGKLSHLRGSSFNACFGRIFEQKEAVTTFIQRMATRTEFLEADHTSTPATTGGAGGTDIVNVYPLCE